MRIRPLFEARSPMCGAGLGVTIFLGTAGSMAGCASRTAAPAPDLAQRSVPVRETFASADRVAAPEESNIPDGWLQEFQDPPMQALVAEALVSNPELREAAAVREEASARVRLARATLAPRIDGVAGAARGASGGSPENALTVGAQVTWEADLWGRLDSAARANLEDALSAELEETFLRESIAALTAQAWYTLVAALHQVNIDKERVAAEEETAHIAAARARVGVGSPLEHEVAEANLSFARHSLEISQEAYEEAVRALELLLGRYPSAELAVAPRLPPLRPLPPVGVPASLLERRPDLIAADRRVAAAFHRSEAERAARLPRVTITASAGLLFDPLESAWSVAADLLAPIFDAGEIQALIDIADAQQERAIAEYVRVALRAFREIEAALASEHFLRVRLEEIRDAERRLSTASRMARQRYQAGAISIFDLTSVRRDYFGVRSQLLAIRTEQINRRIQLYLALGRSFEMGAPAGDGGEQRDGAEEPSNAAGSADA